MNPTAHRFLHREPPAAFVAAGVLPAPSYTVYAWLRREANELVGVVVALAERPYAGRERYERRWDSEDAAVTELAWMARALAERVRRRGHELLGVEFLSGPPGGMA